MERLQRRFVRYRIEREIAVVPVKRMRYGTIEDTGKSREKRKVLRHSILEEMQLGLGTEYVEAKDRC